MGRFASLNADTKDLVNCLLPALAASFKVSDPVEIIPEDIRMRAWDCDRRDHIKDQTENDPRNWGVQFLKDLMAISRMKGGNLADFQIDLRAKVALHEPKHPWCRLADIKELKDEYEHPDRENEVNSEEQYSSEDSYDSYFEELVEPDEPKGQKRGRKPRNHEIYEARVQESTKRRKYGSHGRLRRSEEGGFHRKDKSSHKRYSVDRTTPNSSRQSMRRASRIIHSDRECSVDSAGGTSLHLHPTSAFSVSPGPLGSQVYAISASHEPLAVQKLQAELEVAEAELKAARLKYQYIQAKEEAEKDTKYGGAGTEDAPHTVI
ncbi:Nn.00g100530.m01.CDS01 [Neocucurbitaria sp. VM-36]